MLTLLGFQSVPENPCLFVQSEFLIFLYVDDMIIGYHPSKHEDALRLCEELQQHWELRPWQSNQVLWHSNPPQSQAEKALALFFQCDPCIQAGLAWAVHPLCLTARACWPIMNGRRQFYYAPNLGAQSSDFAYGAELNEEAPSVLPDFRRVAWPGEGYAGTEQIKWHLCRLVKAVER